AVHSSGGGISFTGYQSGLAGAGTLAITDATIEGNTAGPEQGLGGGVVADGQVLLEGSLVVGNHAGRGGGLFVLWDRTTAHDTTFSANTALTGGAIELYPGDGMLTGTGLTFHGNVVTVGAGAIRIAEGGE